MPNPVKYLWDIQSHSSSVAVIIKNLVYIFSYGHKDISVRPGKAVTWLFVKEQVVGGKILNHFGIEKNLRDFEEW